MAWAEAINSYQPVTTLSLNEFVAKLKGVFGHPDHRGNASKRLFNIRQGTRSVADYSVEFRTLAADAGWNDQVRFLNGLCEQLKDELTSHDESTNFDTIVSLAIRLDNRLCERCREKAG